MPQAEPAFDADLQAIDRLREIPLILEICRRATGMRFAAVARVTEERWMTCAVLDEMGLGLQPGDELDISTTLCQEVRANRETVVIEDVDADETYRDHPTPALYGFKSYISAPIIREDGTPWGTLCALDTLPRDIGPEVVSIFHLFTQLIAAGLDGQDDLAGSRTDLDAERATSRLREEFIAVVGHDLRNPVAAVTAGLQLLTRNRPGLDAAALMAEMQRSMLRMQQIIDNLMDFARGRLGEGIALQSSEPIGLEPIIRDVALEIAKVSGQQVETVVDLPHPVRCDPQRIGQLLSNLLGNAVTHGTPDAPIRVEATETEGLLRLAVTNQGPAIPDEVRPSLFLPFARGGERASLQGLGLGLYIAAEIARAHGGRIDVASSDAEGTTFALVMPARR
jgi:signal transduction histidine kinase